MRVEYRVKARKSGREEVHSTHFFTWKEVILKSKRKDKDGDKKAEKEDVKGKMKEKKKQQQQQQ